MILAQLQNFQWLNDPENVIFNALGLRVVSKKGTDFWQNDDANMHKDNGHFFYLPQAGDFTLNLCWDCQSEGFFEQCGIMLRIDDRNWLKASIMFDNKDNPALASCVTADGFSDWATHKLNNLPEKIYYRLKRNKNDYIISYSLDGEKFEQMRMVHLKSNMPLVLAGAYICSPRTSNFTATLTSLDFSA